MKQILLVFITLFWISESILAEYPLSNQPAKPISLNWESDYTSFDQNSSLDNRYLLNYNLPSMWKLQHRGYVRQTSNKRFSRSSYWQDFNWKLGKNDYLFNRANIDYALVFSADRVTDKAEPDDIHYEISRSKKRVGLDLSLALSDSLYVHSLINYVRSDELNSQHLDRSVDSDGYHIHNMFGLAQSIPEADFSFNGYLEQLSIDFDYLRHYGLDGAFHLQQPNIKTRLTFNKETRKIFLLQDRIDTHTRTNYQAIIEFQRAPAKDMKIVVVNRFNVRDNRLTNNRNRNYLETENQVSVNTTYRVWRLGFYNNGGNRYFSRVFKGEIGNREQLHNLFTSGITYRHNERDSLTISRKLSLTRTDYSVWAAGGLPNHLDNDQLVDEQQISLYKQLRERIRIVNHFNYTERKEVYLKALMSGNNKISRTYNLLPSLNIILTENFHLRQDYHLRADYDDFYFKELTDDKMYRKFSASYALLSFFPLRGYAQKNELNSELHSPFADYYPVTEEAMAYADRESLSINIRYIYDTNNSGLLFNDKYEIYAENEFHIIELETIRSYSRFDVRARPRFIWSNIRYEYNHLVEFSYYLPNRLGYSVLSLNPSGRTLTETLWRVNFSLRFNW